jgi:eukaryotic-like serine/threonine-protein kinase
MGVRERIRTIFRLFLLFTVLASIALISFLTTVRFTIRGRQATAPKFVGMPLDKAQRAAAALGLNLKVEDKVFSPQFGPSEIVSQMPPPGMRVKVGQHVHVLVSLGRPEVTVPNVLGSSLRAARITAIQRGLTVGDVATVHWPGPEVDQVVAQDPPPAMAEVRSPTVNFLVSLGGAPPVLLCPSFIGQPLAEVRSTLERAGFKIGQVTSIAGRSTASGSVLLQSPPPGAKIGPATTFNFQVAQ